MKIKKIFKYLVIIYGYFMLILGLISGITILTGGSLSMGIFNMFFTAFAIYTVLILIIITIVMVRLHSKKRKYWIIPLCFGMIVIIFNSLPIVSTPYIIFNGDAQFKNEFGSDYLNHISNDKKSMFMASPLSIWSFLNGIPVPACNISYDDDYYAIRGNDKYHFDVYSPLSGSGPFPCIICIHGGGWVRGDKGQLKTLNQYLANQGYVIFDIRYGLAKVSQMNMSIPFIDANKLDSELYNESIRIPDMVENIGNFTHYLVANKEKYNVNISQVYVLGRSAGAHLAGLFLGYNSTFSYLFNTSIKVRGIILFYPPANLTMMYEYALNDPINQLISGSSPSFFTYLLNGTPISNKINYDIYSPTYHVNNKSPPIIIFHGVQDSLVPYEISVQLQNKMHSYNRPCAIISFPFYGHAMDIIFSGIGGQIPTYYIERFLAYTLENNV
ncbi:MAG: alpha/beta hydrolase fold domain-containing protein [Candidatus Helarchaeota archaeon]